MMVWDGKTIEHHLVCAGLKDQEMPCLEYATRDIRGSAQQIQVLVFIIKTQNDSLAEAIQAQVEKKVGTISQALSEAVMPLRAIAVRWN